MVVHGINSSRHNFDTRIPAAMLAQSGFNVLLILMTSAPGSAAVRRSSSRSLNTSIRCDAPTDKSHLRLKFYGILQGAWPCGPGPRSDGLSFFLFMVFSPEIETGIRYKKNKTLRKGGCPWDGATPAEE